MERNKTKLKLSVIENAVKNGSFGEKVTLVDIVSSDMKGEDHFASAVIFAKVFLKIASDQVSLNIVIKNQQDDPSHREFMNTDIQFYNELIMYKHILPYLENNNNMEKMFPRFFHGVATLGENFEDDMIILEDLRSSGFRLSENRIFLDFNHCKMALTQLGKFHASSYLAKKDDFDQFISQVKKLKEVRMDCNPDSDRFLLCSIERSIIPLDSEVKYKVPLKCLREKTKNPSQLMKDLVQPTEPLAVLCHGDFCRNNILFKYNANGKPKDVRLFDVATARYASPAIDLSFFMLMNTSTELRSSHWNDLLATYHAALVSAAQDCPVPSFEQLCQEFQDKALYGYILSSFFIPMMVDAETPKEVEVDFSTMTPEEMDARNMTLGGDKATRFTSQVVEDLVKFKYISFQ